LLITNNKRWQTSTSQ